MSCLLLYIITPPACPIVYSGFPPPIVLYQQCHGMHVALPQANCIDDILPYWWFLSDFLGQGCSFIPLPAIVKSCRIVPLDRSIPSLNYISRYKRSSSTSLTPDERQRIWTCYEHKSRSILRRRRPTFPSNQIIRHPSSHRPISFISLSAFRICSSFVIAVKID